MKSEHFPFPKRFHFGWAIFWVLTLLLIYGLATGMKESIRNFPLTEMFTFGVIAFLLGWVISGYQQKTPVILIAGMIIGFFLLILINSGAYRNLFLALINGFRVNRTFTPFERYLIDIDLLIYFLQISLANLFELIEEIFTWIFNLLINKARFDPKISNVIWGSFLWSATFSSGWLFRRKNHAFIASLPIMMLLIGVLGYTRQNTTGLVLALFVLLMMFVMVEHLKHENKWVVNKIDFSEALRVDIAAMGIPIILAIILIAYALPNIPFDAIRDFFNQSIFVENQRQIQIDNSLGLQKTPQELSLYATSGGLPRELLIGSGAELSEKLVMEIDTGEVFLPPEIDINSTLPKYYWFGRSYDIYTGEGWISSEINQKNYSKDEIIAPADLENSRLLNLKIKRSRTAPETLYASGIPESVDHRVTVGWRNATNEYYSAQIDALEYQVDSPHMDFSEYELHQSTETAPEEILETYLQIPEETPLRIYELASSITEDIQNSYDKAKAIESYLRQFEYTLDVPKPNPDRDVVDFFLFDLQKGYCDYFASAMVILSRTINLPARLAVGYTTGEYDYERHVFIVSEANAHAWPEIYIAPYGWVPFEPTTSLRPFAWNLEEDLPETLGDESDPADIQDQTKLFWKNLLILIGILLSIIISALLWYKTLIQRPQSTPTSQQIEKIYLKMIKNLTSFFIPPQSSKTPLEFQKDLINYFNKQESSQLLEKFLNSIAKNLMNITELYIQAIYSPLPISNMEVSIARKKLNELCARTWLVNFLFIFKKSKT
jgi:transglutaminase-like putative cysteine protease